jgi:sugar phosphate isomerase/epimerase
MTGAELRVLWGRNVMDLTAAELDRAKAILDEHGLRVVGISSPLLKCVLPDSPPLDKRFEHDVFASAHTYDDQPRLLRRAIEIAHQMGAPVIRVFPSGAPSTRRDAWAASPNICAPPPDKPPRKA